MGPAGGGAAQPPPLPSVQEIWSAAVTTAHAAAAPMLAAGVPSALATLLLLAGVLAALWAVARVLLAFRQAFDARELLFDDGSGSGLLGGGGGRPFRRAGLSGRWMGGKHGGYYGAGGDLPLFPEDVHLQCSHWAETGGREYMEDRVAFAGRLQGRNGASYYAVFDGHGGALAAEYCREHMHRHLMDLGEALHDAPVAALKEAFVATDLEFMRAVEGTERVDGTTALVSLVLGKKLYVANAGDSRAILVQRGARAVALSRDHKPSLPDELRRITNMGGKVIFWGRWRVEGILAVSRAIGDRHLKPYVTPEPEVCEWALTDRDCFLVLATDGIWDVLSNEAVAQMVMNASHDLKWAARQLCEAAHLHGSLDNMAAVVVDLRDHAAHECYHYYHREAHAGPVSVSVARGGEGVGVGLGEAREEVEEEGEGAFFDDSRREGVSFAERRFRRNVTVCMARSSSSSDSSSSSKDNGGAAAALAAAASEGEEDKGNGQGREEEERLLAPPTPEAATVSPSKRALASLLSRRGSKQRQQQPQQGGGGGKKES